jgi:hypothetical protein
MHVARRPGFYAVPARGFKDTTSGAPLAYDVGRLSIVARRGWRRPERAVDDTGLQASAPALIPPSARNAVWPISDVVVLLPIIWKRSYCGICSVGRLVITTTWDASWLISDLAISHIA